MYVNVLYYTSLGYMGYELKGVTIGYRFYMIL